MWFLQNLGIAGVSLACNNDDLRDESPKIPVFPNFTGKNNCRERDK